MRNVLDSGGWGPWRFRVFIFSGGGGETKTAPLSPSVSGCFAVLCPGSALVGWGQGAELPGSALLGGVRGLGLLP